MKNVLVTGGCCFIGSHFLNYFVPKYKSTNFYNIDCLNYCASLSNVKCNENKNYKFIKGDICDSSLVSFILREYNIDTIVHFAAQSHVDNSFSTPLQYTKDNIKGTHTLLECVRLNCKNFNLFFHISTDEVYGSSYDGEDPKHEGSFLLPTNPYAATKAAAEMLVMSYHYSFSIPVVITRGNNVFGPNQYHEKLIPKFIKLLRAGEKCTIHGKGDSKRSFVYVDDTIRAIELIISSKLNKYKINIFNIGTREEYSVMEVTKNIIKLVCPPNTTIEDRITFVEDRKFNDIRYFIDYSKLKKLGWTPSITFKEGLSRILKTHS